MDSLLSAPATPYITDRSESIAERMARLQQMTQVPTNEKQAKLKEAATEFEAVFISQMLEHMFAGIETNELFGGGEAEDIYRSMMVEEYGKLMAKAGGVGIADHVMRQLLHAQEAAPSGLKMPKDGTDGQEV